MLDYLFQCGAVGQGAKASILVSAAPQIKGAHDTLLIMKREISLSKKLIVKADIIAICAIRTENTEIFAALGRTGDVFLFDMNLNLLSHEMIGDAGLGPDKFGYLRALRTIGADIMACGHMGQIYVRSNNVWQRADSGLRRYEPLNMKANSFRDLAGVSQNDYYSIGSNGRIYHFAKGNYWDVSPPTNVELLSIAYLGDDQYIVGGKRGVCFKGNKKGWELIAEDIDDTTIWDIVIFNNKIYLATEKGLWVLSESGLELIAFKGVPLHDAYHLDTNGKILYYFGQQNIYLFDFFEWHKIDIGL